MNLGQLIVEELMDELNQLDIQEDLIQDAVYDPGIFKAVFLAGGPGSGKTTVSSEIFGVPEKFHFSVHGLRSVNTDAAFEQLLKKAGYGTRLDKLDNETFEKITSNEPSSLRSKAKDTVSRMLSLYLNGRLGIIMDSTGASLDKVQKQLDVLKSLGYDCLMIFVNTSLETALARNKLRPRVVPDAIVANEWHKAQSNMGKYQSMFSNNFIIVDNNTMGVTIPSTVTSTIDKFIRSPIKNYVGKTWIQRELELKNKNRVYEEVINEESEAAKEAKRKGLEYDSFGRWKDKSGKVVAKTEGGKLVSVGKGGDTKTQPPPSSKSDKSPEGSKEKGSQGKMTLVGVYSGRFQPFGRHHFAAYKQLQAVTGANTFIATSDVTDTSKSPFQFADKKKIIMKYGISGNRIVRTKNPYAPTEILDKFDPKTTALVVIFGEKDAGRLGGKYYIPFAGAKDLEGYKDKGYYIIAQHESVVVGGKELSGTQIRKFLGSHKIAPEKKKKLFKSIFGWYDPALYGLITHKVGAITPKNEGVLSSTLLTEGGAYGIDYTICEECKSRTKQIGSPHMISVHHMTLEEYKHKHPDSILVSEVAKCFGNKNPMKNSVVAEKHKKIMSNVTKTREFRDAVSRGLIGKPRTDMIGAGNIAKRNDVRKKISDGVIASYNDPKLMELRREQFTSIRNSDKYKDRMYELGLWKRPEFKKKWERYYEKVKLITEQNFSKYFHFIPLAASRSREYHLDHIVSVDYGFCHDVRPEIIGHKNNLRIVHHTINESKGRNNTLTLEQLIHSIGEMNNPLDTRILLLQGGAYGHMSHPFDDQELTFGDFKNIIDMALEGHLDKEAKVMEKLDGQALSVSWVNGKVVAARNKSHLKNGGVNALDIAGIKGMFAGRGEVAEAFSLAMEDLQAAIKGLSEKQKAYVFDNGKNFMALEIVYPKTENVLPYGQSMLIFHGLITYDNNGVPIGENKGAARMLAGMIRQIDSDVQKTFKISAPSFVSVPPHQDFAAKKDYFIGKVDRLKNKFGLKDGDTVALYHQRWWENFVSRKARSMKYALSNTIQTQLVKRWAFDDKSNRMIDIVRGIKSPEFAEWVKTFDKENHEAQMKENMLPFETLFLELGSEVLSNASGFLAANPNKSVQSVRKKVDAAVKQLKASKDLGQLRKLKTELGRIQAIGGFDKIVPAEGLVFTYNGKTYKLTGAFAPVNQLLGMLKYND